MHEDMSLDGNEVDEHPHDLEVGTPDRLPSQVVRQLSVLSPGRALLAVAVEWAAIALAIAAFEMTPAPWVYALYIPLVIFIGARQHALTVIGHDASHHRFLPGRFLNDGLADLLLQWPMFISVVGFRKFHGAHHRFLGEERDGNRFLWKTHTAEGQLSPEWVYPKTRLQLAGTLVRRAFFFTGLWWMVRGLLGVFVVRSSWANVAARLAYYGAFAALFTWRGWWLDFGLLWLVPFCTWHMAIQYMRLISEHSAVRSADEAFAQTRTTIPRWWEALLILPRNIGYHLEHHWYPSVPFYNLPALHSALMENARFRDNVVLSRSILSSLADVSHPREAA